MLDIKQFIIKIHRYKNGKTVKQKYFKASCSQCNTDKKIFISKHQDKISPLCKSCSAKKRIEKYGNSMLGKKQKAENFRVTHVNVNYNNFKINKTNTRLYSMTCIQCGADRGFKPNYEALRLCIKCHTKKHTKRSKEQTKIYKSMCSNMNVRFAGRKIQKDYGVFRWLPYTIDDLIKHLESQFEPWMNWDNHGIIDKNKRTWQIDHIIADSNFQYSSVTDDGFKKSWALSNLRPLGAIENILKSNK